MIRVFCLILVVMSAVAFAQTNEKPKAVKLQELGTVPDGFVKVAMDPFYVELANDPTAQGIIFNYGTDNEIARREKQIAKAIMLRRYDDSRITVVRAGFWKELKTEFWIVPADAEIPQPKSTAEKFDEFGKILNGELKARLDNLYVQLENKPNSHGYILIYGSAKTIAATEKQINKSIAFRKLDISKVTIKNAGSSKVVKTEFYIVPLDEK